MPYLLSLSSYGAELQEASQYIFLECLNDIADAFPLELQLSEDTVKTLVSPADFDRSAVPGIYRIDGTNFRIPLYSQGRELEVIFSESSEPQRFPAQFLVTIAAIERSGLWPLGRLVDLIANVTDALPIDHAFVCDEQQLDREVYADRTCSIDLSQVPLGVFWVNFLSTKLLGNIGGTAEQAIRRQAVITRSVRSGLVFATQERPFRAGLPEDESLLGALEALFDYRRLQRRFPLVL